MAIAVLWWPATRPIIVPTPGDPAVRGRIAMRSRKPKRLCRTVWIRETVRRKGRQDGRTEGQILSALAVWGRMGLVGAAKDRLIRISPLSI